MRHLGSALLLTGLCVGVVVLVANANLFGQSSPSVVAAEALLVGALVFAVTYLIRPASGKNENQR